MKIVYPQNYEVWNMNRLILIVSPKEKFNALFIPDTHFPEHHPDLIQEILDYIKKEKPNFIFHMGDALNNGQWGKWSLAEQNLTPKQEFEKGLKLLANLWDIAHKYTRLVACFQLFGNHDGWILRDIRESNNKHEKYVKDGLTRDFQDATKNVNLVGAYGSEVAIFLPKTEDEYQFLINQPYNVLEHRRDVEIYVTHGLLGGIGSHAKERMTNVVVGHTHRGGTTYVKCTGANPPWELSTGHVVNDRSGAFDFMKSYNRGWIPGYGIVKRDKKGRLDPHFKNLFK